MFGKPGRPPEDRLLRQREIYLSVAPLIEQTGAKQLTMRQAAAAAHMSVGGLYHYFPSKRDLVLHGLNSEASERVCMDFLAQHRHLEADAPAAYLEAHLNFMVYKMTSFMRPALLAALELGVDPVMDSIEAAVDRGLEGFVGPLRAVFPDRDAAEIRGLGRAMRRMFIASLLDRSITPTQLRDELMVISGINHTPRTASA